jgi:antitoxin component of MazEF toxin-antitoxin module
MIVNIRKIGNSKGIIIPKNLLQDIGFPESVDITLVDDGLLLCGVNKIVRRKPRNEDESEGLYQIMKAELDADLKSGKLKFIGEREVEVIL